ncbi:uncharacterized protein [Diadema antillarum]|uniref:uncharacterized protein n=1 Tax=Diadema antillarum TaxID=105358 RepID=UPI003A8BA526
MGKTAVLLLGLLTGFVSLIFQSVSLGTEYWFEGTLTGTLDSQSEALADYYENQTSLNEIPALVRNRGLFSFCGYYYDANASSTTVPSPTTSVNFQAQGDSIPPYAVVRCITYNFTQTPNPALPGLGYHRTLYYLDRTAAALGCIMMGLQLCGVLTSCQAAWTVITVLFTDCGTMFMFGAFFGMTSLLMIVASAEYEVNERPLSIRQLPEIYTLSYSWSFYVSWAAFGLCFASGVMFLMVARQWHLEEVWLKKSLEEEKKRMPQQRYSRSKLMPSF